MPINHQDDGYDPTLRMSDLFLGDGDLLNSGEPFNIYLPSSYDYLQIKISKISLTRFHRRLAAQTASGKLSIAKLFRVLESGLLKAPYKIYVNHQPLSLSVFIAPIALRTFYNFRKANLSPDILNFNYETNAWVHASLQIAAKLKLDSTTDNRISLDHEADSDPLTE